MSDSTLPKFAHPAVRRLIASAIACALLATAIALPALAAPATAQVNGTAKNTAAQNAQMYTIKGLGSIAFPTSTKSPAAQHAFVHGVMLLHLFEFDDAKNEFRKAEKIDPGFAMAYWGEAMTHDHPIWGEYDNKASRAALDKLGTTDAARVAKAPTTREKDYIAAVDILFFGKGNQHERDARYSDAMQKLAAAYPHDNNAQLFYALSLMGRTEGVRNEHNYLQAAAIVEHVFKVNPRNPGAAHYWIHSMDDPAHAAGALPAAYAIIKLSPDAAHAQHMASHIFMALGMWDGVVKANLTALAVMAAQNPASQGPMVTCGHAYHWLEYGYFQQGRMRDGEHMLDACAQSYRTWYAWLNSAPSTKIKAAEKKQLPTDIEPYYASALSRMRNAAIVESQNWNGPAVNLSVNIDGLGAFLGGDAIWKDFVDGYAAAQRGDMQTAQAKLTTFDAYVAKRAHSKNTQELDYLHVMGNELGGLLKIKDGQHERGLAMLRQATTQYQSIPFDYGPPATVVPPGELLGKELLALHQPTAAKAAFATALKRAPKRTESLIGLARADAASGDTTDAVATYKKLVAIWHAADPGLPGLTEAKHYLASHGA